MTGVDELKTAGNDGSKAESSKVAFTPEQQEKVQHLIDDAYRKAYSRASKNLSTGEELEVLKKEVETLKGEKKMVAILRAVARHNVVDPEEVAEFISGHVAADAYGRVTVKGDEGKAGEESYPMTLEEYVEKWLSERPHHLRSTGGAGGGSQGARFMEGAKTRYNLNDPKVWRNMPREDLDKLLKEGINVHGAGQVFRFRDVSNPFLEARKKKFQSGG